MAEIRIMDVTPRDGLQDAEGFVPTEDKAALIEGLVRAGMKRVEVTSFVSAKWVPLLADLSITHKSRWMEDLPHCG